MPHEVTQPQTVATVLTVENDGTYNVCALDSAGLAWCVSGSVEAVPGQTSLDLYAIAAPASVAHLRNAIATAKAKAHARLN